MPLWLVAHLATRRRKGGELMSLEELKERYAAVWPFPIGPADGGYPDVHASYSIPGEPSVPAWTFAALPAGRRWAIERQTAKTRELEGRGIGDPALAGPCPLNGVQHRVASEANLGSDSRYHPIDAEGGAICAGTHEQLCPWARDENGHYTVHGVDERGEYTVRWEVIFDSNDPVPATQVKPAQRCPIPPVTVWPLYAGGSGQLPRLRAALLEAGFGPECMICGSPDGRTLDHDHDTGLIRGILCRWCNGQVDLCPHLSGCRMQEYLDRPPLTHLRLLHPQGHRRDR